MLEYYTQRASEGGLIVSEATPISIAGGGWFGAPGLYSDEQVAGWRRITNAVHEKRGYMFSQLWHTGRASHVDTTLRRRFQRAKSEGDLPANVDPADLARYIATVLYGMAVQAAGGASRSKLQAVVEMVLRTLPM